MRTFFVNQATNNLQTGRADTGSIGTAGRTAGAVALPWGSMDAWRIGFLATTGTQTNADLGSTISGQLILKAQGGTNPYDGPALTACAAWTKTTVDTQVWYDGILDLSRLELAKLLGSSIRTAKEKLLIQCVADVDRSLQETTFKLAFDATHFCYFDFLCDTGATTVPGSGNFQYSIEYTENDSASTIATALAGAINAMTADLGYTASAAGANVTAVKTTVMTVGQSDPLATGFSTALLALGGNAEGQADVATVTLNAEFSYVVGGSRQICNAFTVQLNNSLYRSGQVTIPDGLTVVSSLDVPVRVPVTGYTGGSGKLDGIATASGAMATGQVVWFVHATEGIRFFQLTAGTDAESSPAIIRPDDYNGSTNARVWKQV